MYDMHIVLWVTRGPVWGFDSGTGKSWNDAILAASFLIHLKVQLLLYVLLYQIKSYFITIFDVTRYLNLYVSINLTM